MADIKRWTSNAAGNILSPPDGAPEGWAPADVNNVIRENMGAVRRWYEDPDFTDYDHTPTFVTAISFTIAGDHTARYAVDRRIRCDVGGTLLFGDITSRTATGGVTTTVLVDLDSGSLTSSLTGVAVGILTPAGHPGFDGSLSGTLRADQILGGSMSLSGDAVVTGALRGGTGSISGLLTAGSLSVSGVTAITGAASFGSTMSVSGRATFKDQLSVSGTLFAPQIALGGDPTVSLGAVTKQYADAATVSQATKGAIEAETDQNTYAPPDLIRHSPGAAKFWLRFDGSAAGPITPAIDFNVVDVTDSGTGLYIINISTDFSTANFSAFAIAQDVSSNGAIIQIDSNPAAGTFSIEITNRAGLAIDPNIVCAGGFGVQ